MFFKKKQKKKQPITREITPKEFQLYRGAGYGGELRVESIFLLFYDNNKCEGVVNCGDFTPMGGGGFSIPLPDELVKNLSENSLTEFFKPHIEKFNFRHDCYFKITIPDELKQYIADIN